MKTFIVLATLVAASSAAWVFLPLPGVGNRPEILPPSVDPIRPSVPEVDPIHPEVPLPPGISPEVPVIPPKPELPKPIPPFVEPSVHYEVLNFPSDEDPQVRVHVNIKQENPTNFPAHRIARSILNLPGLIFPGLKPSLPEAGNKPAIPEPGNKPEIPEAGNKPEIPEAGNKPEILPPPEIIFPTPEVDPSNEVHTYIYPNFQHQLVKLRVQYNKPSDPIGVPAPSPYKIDFPELGNKPAIPEAGHKPEIPGPIIPMPMPPIGQKVPQVELFLDIGEQENY